MKVIKFEPVFRMGIPRDVWIEYLEVQVNVRWYSRLVFKLFKANIIRCKCSDCGVFEVEQPMMAEHKATCTCGKPAQRVYIPLMHFWPDCLWNPDGSKQSPDELPSVPSGNQHQFSGFGEGK
jgi:hypothetical protein